MIRKILLFIVAVLVVFSFVCCSADKEETENMDLNSPQFADMIQRFVKEEIAKQLPKADKRFIGTVVAIGEGTATVNLANDTPAVDIVVANPNEIPIELGDQVSIVAENGHMYNAFIEFRKGITFDRIYVDATNGTDAYGFDASGNAYGSQLAPFATIQYAVNRLPKNLNGREINIECVDVDPTEDVVIDNFYGSGFLTIFAPTTATSRTIVGFTVVSCNNAIVVLSRFTLTDNIAVSVRNSKFVEITNMNITTVAAGGTGVVVRDSSSCQVDNCVISNKGTAIEATSLSRIYSLNNTGTGNTVALSAVGNSTIGKFGTQPSGSETTSGGSVIR